jgi:fumarate reductase flavoprotein subunit
MPVLPAAGRRFDEAAELVIVGAGATGLVAALAAREAGATPLVLERDKAPAGSTALSAGLIMAAGTSFQRAKGIADSPALMAGDLLRKNHGACDLAVLDAVCAESGPAVDWLADRHGVPLSLVEGFLYPGHSVARMHGPPSRAGSELMGALIRAVEAAGIGLVTGAAVTDLFAAPDGRVAGLAYARPNGARETVSCRALVLACSGFGGDPERVRRHIPAMADALYFGHPGNRGDAVAWGEALGAALADMGACQGHGSVAHPHGALITWGLMMGGGVQVNAEGRRFSNEHRGYSEQAPLVLAQPGGVAWCLYDARLDALGRDFEDYRQAAAAGAVHSAPTPEALAGKLGLPPTAVAATLAESARFARGEATDSFGRVFPAADALAPPYFGIKVTGALFHTQGGLVVDRRARVRRPDGSALPNLWAGGGAARGLSGPGLDGYLSGNGILPAVTLGRIAGREAARFLAGGG